MTAANVSDSRVIDSVLKGDADAFGVLVERHYSLVQAIALAHTHNAADADDVFQETFVKAYSSLGRLRKRDRVGAWLATIARNSAISLHRKDERLRRTANEIEATESFSPDPIREELFERLRGYVDALSPALGEVVLLHYFAGYKLREIATICDVSANTAEKRLVRARAKLGERILRDLAPELKESGGRESKLARLMSVVAIAAPPVAQGSIATSAASTAAVAVGFSAYKLLGAIALVSIIAALAFVTLNDSTGNSELLEPEAPELSTTLASQSATDLDDLSAAGSEPSDSETSEPPVAEAQPQPEGDEEQAAPEFGSIHGRVIDEATDEGVAKITVTATSVDGSVQFASAATDETGLFSVEGLPAGDYKVRRGAHPDYQGDDWTPDLRSVSVVAGKMVEGLEFRMSLGVTVSGQVLRTTGEAVPFARILIGGGTNIFFNERIVADESGFYTIAGLVPTGDVWLAATSEGLAHKPHGPVTIEKEGIENLDLTMNPESVLEGIVVDGKDKPLSGYSLDFDSESRGRMGGNSTETTQDGTFRQDAVPPGKYTVIVNPVRSGPNWRTVASLEVGEGEHLSKLRFVYDAATDLTISGRVTDSFGKPVANQRVSYIPSEARSVTMSVHTDDNGNYEIPELSEGLYNVDVTLRRPRRILQLASRNRVAAGSEHVDFTVKLYTSISGRVVDAQTGDAVQEFVLQLGGMDTAFGAGRHFSIEAKKVHNAGGNFTIEDVTPGPATLIVRAEGYTAGLESLTAIEGEPLEDVIIALSAGGTIEGHVVNTNRSPIAGAQIHLGPLLVTSWSNVKPEAVTDADGAFVLDAMPAEPVVISVYHEDFAFNARTINPATESTLTIILSKGGVLEGGVFIDGEPMNEGQLSIQFESGHRDGRFSEIALSDEGRFEVSLIPSEPFTLSYGIRRSDTDIQSVKVPLNVQNGERMSLDLHLPSGSASLSGDIETDTSRFEWLQVQALYRSSDEEHFFTTVAENGSFDLRGLPAGDVALIVRGRDADHVEYFSETPVTIGEGGSTSVTLPLDRVD